MSSSSFFFIILSLVFLFECSNSQIPLGSKLSAGENQPWVSEDRTFAFGFAPADSSDQLLLAIWYAELPGNATIVWSPNRDSPVTSNAVVKLEQSGNLALYDRGNLIWASNTTGLDVGSAIMSDSGSFILYNGTGSNRNIAWQSFWLPGDTLLPGQNLSASLELTSNRSRFGYYSLKMLQQHMSLSLALTFVTFDSQTNYSYWSSPQISNATGNIVAVLDASGSFSIMYGDSSAGTVYIHKNDTAPNPSILRRIKVDTDGNLRLYQWNTITLQWDVQWSAVSNPCEVAGICGNGICQLNGSGIDASCTSLKPVNSGSCGGNLRMETMPQTDYYFLGRTTIANYSNVTTADECSSYCLSHCGCVAAVYGSMEDDTYCWTLSSVVFGGLQDPSSTFFVKVDGSSGPGSVDGRRNADGHGGRSALLPLLLCVSALVLLLGMLVCYLVRKRRIKEKRGIGRALSLPGAPVYFSYHDLQTATANFSQLLGTGGFGSVYKGTLKDGTSIAVKKLERFLPHGEREFVTEVSTIGSMHHMNLVTLCGFCSERTHRSELTSENPMRVADRRLKGKVEEDELVRALSTAFWCIQEEAWVRPSMGEVVRMLEGSVDINTPPMPQTVVELVEEGADSVYMAMKREYSYTVNSSYVLYSQRSSSLATCSTSSMSPR
ncbi:uncharacterized protein A4U43_C05F17980 [Asparagus officinalis]|uniref:Receptor-like serine/threonine-protein kinase n=1 Tax=Asparagus officinalis TaxID=4686 RepID=A0A5P1ESF3_ASPOF|nr:uncharacterized protein A4U43_C05F17980 [Asparagus officinalis]